MNNYIKLWIGIICLFIGLVQLLGQTDCVTNWDYNSLSNTYTVNITQRFMFCTDQEKQNLQDYKDFVELKRVNRIAGMINLSEAGLIK